MVAWWQFSWSFESFKIMEISFTLQKLFMWKFFLWQVPLSSTSEASFRYCFVGFPPFNGTNKLIKLVCVLNKILFLGRCCLYPRNHYNYKFGGFPEICMINCGLFFCETATRLCNPIILCNVDCESLCLRLSWQIAPNGNLLITNSPVPWLNLNQLLHIHLEWPRLRFTPRHVQTCSTWTLLEGSLNMFKLDELGPHCTGTLTPSPGPSSPLMVGKWAVCILLECFLVYISLWFL